MESIIIIRVSDPDGQVFQNILDAVNSGASTDPHIQNTELIFPGLRINMNTGIVGRDGGTVTIQLNNSEYRILCHLAQYPNRIFTKDQLYTAVYNEPCYHTNTVPTTIWRLRNKLGRDTPFIKTVVGFGYKFEIPKK